VLLNELKQLSSYLPNLKSEIDRVSEVSKAAGEGVAELEGIPDSVKDFLRNAANGNALLSDLTEEVKQWLANHNMLHQFRVRFG